jgi:hypothetical protein
LRIELEEPNRVEENNDKFDPTRPIERKDMDEANVIKSKTEIADPNRE